MSDTSFRHAPERRQRELLEQIFETTQLSTFDLFRNFAAFTPRITLARFLAHLELFRKVVDLPGAIIDIGVYRGGSTFTWAKLCEIFCPTDVLKIVYGFDTFEGFPALSTQDGSANESQDLRAGGYASGPSVVGDLELARQAMNADRHLNGVERIEFIKGDVSRTVPEFVKAAGPGLRVSLLNLDADLYEPTRVALEHFEPLMVHGGIIVLDEYGVRTFGGESTAVHEYFDKKFGRRPPVRKLTWHSNPSAYIEVDW